MHKIVIMGAGRMGSLIRRLAEAARDEAGEPVFEVVAQIGFDLTELEGAPAADALIDFSNVATFEAVAAYVRRCGCALVSGTTGYSEAQMAELRALGERWCSGRYYRQGATHRGPADQTNRQGCRYI